MGGKWDFSLYFRGGIRILKMMNSGRLALQLAWPPCAPARAAWLVCAAFAATLPCLCEGPAPPLHSLPLHSPSPSLLCLSLPAPWPSGQDAAAADVSLPLLLLPPAAATISTSSPLPHGRSAVSQGCRCSRQHCHQQGRRGRRWRTWPGGCGPLLAGPRPGTSEARRRQAPARVSRCSAAAPPSPKSPLRPSPTSHSASSAS